MAFSKVSDKSLMHWLVSKLSKLYNYLEVVFLGGQFAVTKMVRRKASNQIGLDPWLASR